MLRGITVVIMSLLRPLIVPNPFVLNVDELAVPFQVVFEFGNGFGSFVHLMVGLGDHWV
jgi:hypothetical protein